MPTTKPNQVVFIHGLWLHSEAWEPWLDLFESEGYRVHAPGWPGEGATVAETRGNPDGMNGVGIEQIFDHYKAFIATLDELPIVIGHSFGGLIAQELLACKLAAAAVAIEPAGIKGIKTLPLAQLRSAFPALRNPANRARTVALNARQFRYAFGNTLCADESNELHQRWSIPGPGLPIFQEAGANLSKHSPAQVDTHVADRGPLLLTSGTDDHVVPFKVTEEVVKMYSDGPSHTDFHIFDSRGHSLVIDHEWRDVANVALHFLARHGL